MNQGNQQMVIQFSAGGYSDLIAAELNSWQEQHKLHRLWENDASLWTNSDEGNWLGWLNVAAEKSEVPRIEALAKEIKTAGFTDLVLMGMGGSSLCPAMMAQTFGKIPGYPRLHILDSTDPLQIRHLAEGIDLKQTFFIISSKSGSTLEPNIFKEYFYTQLQSALNKTEVGDHFLAITDPGTSLETMAEEEHFKAIFHGVPSIGGRYSALSNFGMVPAGLMGVDVKEFLEHAKTMQAACSPSILVKDNPGVVLGIILGICAKHGKNKVTLLASPAIDSLGAWLEQLLAESTGKEGKGLLPVDQEPLGEPAVYGDDRIFVYIRLAEAPDLEQERAVSALEQSGAVVIKLHLPDKMHLGAELFRWEIATAVAGSILGINPFNQPDVEESKVLTSQLTTRYEQTGKLTQCRPFYSEENIELFTDEKNARDISLQLVGTPSISRYLQAHFKRIRQGDYVDISAFIEMSDEHTNLLQQSRILIRDNKRIATCLGYGPRFLHSTGQYYKGGPNTGVFLQITAEYKEDIQVPSHRYTFGLVITTQAQADFTVLANRSRRILRVHLKGEVKSGLQRLHKFIQQALQTS